MWTGLRIPPKPHLGNKRLIYKHQTSKSIVPSLEDSSIMTCFKSCSKPSGWEGASGIQGCCGQAPHHHQHLLLYDCNLCHIQITYDYELLLYIGYLFNTRESQCSLKCNIQTQEACYAKEGKCGCLLRSLPSMFPASLAGLRKASVCPQSVSPWIPTKGIT